MEEKVKDLCASLYSIGCFKFGKFILQNDVQTNYYIDLRNIISFPSVMSDLCNLMKEMARKKQLKYDTVCGVPYTALPLSTVLAVDEKKPMVLRRKEMKAYGMQQLIDGIIVPNAKCLVIDDVISSGNSILETIMDLHSAGLNVKDVLIAVDREENGVANLSARGFHVHTLITITQILEFLKEQNVNASLISAVEKQRLFYIGSRDEQETGIREKMRLERRSELCKCAVGKKLFQIMLEKMSNICFAADFSDTKKLLKLASDIGQYICILKINSDILNSFSVRDKNTLKNLAERNKFLIMDDRRLADIGSSVQLQFETMAQWASIVSVHGLPGFGILDCIASSAAYDSQKHAVVLVTDFANTNTNPMALSYSANSVRLANANQQMVVGVMEDMSSNVISYGGLICMSAQVNTMLRNKQVSNKEKEPENDDKEAAEAETEEEGEEKRKASLVVSIDCAILRNGVDIPLISSQELLLCHDPIDKMKECRLLAWGLYLNRIST